MKRLIVNADDFGANPGRNRGIVEAYEKGVVTSLSVIVNAPHASDLTTIVKAHPDLSVGLHLNLSEGRPLIENAQTLANGYGYFFGKMETRRLAEAGKLDPAEVELEVERQILRLVDLGTAPTHMDGHQHIHIHPALAHPIARAARRLGIRWIRCPVEEDDRLVAVPPARLKEMNDYAALARMSRRIYETYGLKSPDRFFGIRLTNQMTREIVTDFFRSLRDGLAEFMVHPGYAEPTAGPFSGHEREQELSVLTDPDLGNILKEEKIKLVGSRTLAAEL